MLSDSGFKGGLSPFLPLPPPLKYFNLHVSCNHKPDLFCFF